MDSLHKNDLLQAALRFSDESPTNRLAAEVALRPDLAGMRIYGEPILAVADADDPLFTELQDEKVIGPHFILPKDWLPGARSVISFFMPFTEQVVAANRSQPVEIPPEWLHGRIEGQIVVDGVAACLRDMLEKTGSPSLIPSKDTRFWSVAKAPEVKADGTKEPGFTSNWSERHVAYVCGLGTFGLSRGLITKSGMAGRFGSLVTTMALEPDKRPYTRYDEYCTYCGACAPRCPVKAIDPETGKNILTCSAFQAECRIKYAPRYGCGKCSVGVPCTRGIPSQP